MENIFWYKKIEIFVIFFLFFMLYLYQFEKGVYFK